MSGSAHTPGPWNARRYHDSAEDDRGDLRVYAATGYKIAEGMDFSGSPVNEANARLIASAPDLLEALERLVIQMSNLLLVCDVPDRFAASFNDGQRQAEAAIAKATGQAHL